jgi:hypothetical protein
MADGGWAAANWHQRARAGLERRLSADPTTPYVVKDPWLFAYCDQLDMSTIHIDTLIVPMRGLMSAAESRVHQERMALSEQTPARDFAAAQVAAGTVGGVLYSLDVVDQARLLAVAFHNLLEWAVRNELPLVLLEFPRLAEDREYLMERLWPWLGSHCTLEVARRAFAATAAPETVRVGRPAPAPLAGAVLGRAEPDRVLVERRALLDRIEELEESETEHREAAAAAVQHASNADLALQQALRRTESLQCQLTDARRQLEAVRASRFWRWTRPLRGLNGRSQSSGLASRVWRLASLSTRLMKIGLPSK